jgi:hypothetical protein
MKKAFSAVAMMAVAAALLLAVSGGTKPNIAPVSKAKIDTLCVYELHYAQWKGHGGTRIFKDNAHLTTFLDSTGYDENDSSGYGTIKKIEHQPDFKKHIYFTRVGFLDWRFPPMVDISEGQDTVTIIYTRLVPPESIDGRCPKYAPPLMNVHVYFIPFTEKKVTISDTMERFKCDCGRH